MIREKDHLLILIISCEGELAIEILDDVLEMSLEEE